MENEFDHIDHSLNKHLRDLEFQPPESSEQNLFALLEHLSHPVDFSLNKHLSELDSPLPLSFDQLLQKDNLSTHVIDTALKNNLSDFSVNSPDFSTYPEKKKRRLAAFWLIVPALLGLYGLYEYVSVGDEKNAGHDNMKSSQLTNEKTHLKTVVPDQEYLPVEKNNYDKPSGVPENNISNSVSGARGEWHPVTENVLTPESEFRSEESLTDDEIKPFSVLRNPSEFPLLFEDVLIPFARQIVKTERPASVEVSLLSFELAINPNRESNNSSISPEWIHKDAKDLFNRGFGLKRNGIGLNINASQIIGKRFKVSLGVRANHTSSNTDFSYTYNQLPVYDSTGKLNGYLTVPERTVRTNIKSVSTEIRMPISIGYEIIRFRAFNIGVMANADLNLYSKNQFPLFDYRRNRFYEAESRLKKVKSGGLGIYGQYWFSPAFGLNFQMNFNIRQGNMNYQDVPVESKRTERDFRIGLLYRPLIRIKK